MDGKIFLGKAALKVFLLISSSHSAAHLSINCLADRLPSLHPFQRDPPADQNLFRDLSSSSIAGVPVFDQALKSVCLCRNLQGRYHKRSHLSCALVFFFNFMFCFFFFQMCDINSVFLKMSIVFQSRFVVNLSYSIFVKKCLWVPSSSRIT